MPVESKGEPHGKSLGEGRVPLPARDATKNASLIKVYFIAGEASKGNVVSAASAL